jgi:hypothetical protein
MSIRSLGAVAHREQRVATGTGGTRGSAVPTSSADPAASRALSGLEAAIPSEVIALYTAIIAGCEAVLAEDPAGDYLPFRVVVYALGLACTGLAAALQVPRSPTLPVPGSRGWQRAAWPLAWLRRHRILGSPSWLTAVLAFGAWGLVLPGSFVYVWLSSALLSLTVVTVTAVSTFLLAVVLAPRVGRPRGSASGRAMPPMVPVPKP